MKRWHGLGQFTHHRFLLAAVHVLALIIVYSAVSAAVMDRFMTRGTGIYHPKGWGFDKYLEQTMPAPFAYRVLVPIIVKAIEPAISSRLSENQKYELTAKTPLRGYMKVKEGDEINLTMSVRYHIAYFISFASLVAFAFVLRALAKAVNPDERHLANLAPIAFLILLPLSFLHGGYLYDFPELLFLGILTWAIVKNRLAILCCVLPLAILNKETAILIPILFFAYYWNEIPKSVLAKRVGLLIVISIVGYFLGRYLAPDTGGGMVLDNLKRNSGFLLDWQSWLLWFQPYGGLIPFPRGYNVLFVALAIAFIMVAWPKLSPPTKRMLLAIIVINFYLVIAHGYRDEMRNWSLSFIPLYLAIMEYLARPTVAKA